jgi:LysR family transcriptional regulator of gallate degradation
VTRAISQLEYELAAPLFERSVRGMLPTEFGEALLCRVERAFAYMDTASREITAITGLDRHAPVFDLHMTERQLHVLIELGHQRHMGAVANALAISQPAVSLTLRNIEQYIGVRLFERTVRGVRPTSSGETLIRHLRLALNEIRIAADEIAAIRGVEQGEVRVGDLSLGRTYLLPAAITRLLRKHPGLKISTIEGPFETLTAALRSGTIDFIIGALRPPTYTEGLSREPLVNDEMAIVTRAGHPLCLRKHVEFHDLANAQWVMPHRNTSTRALLEGT